MADPAVRRFPGVTPSAELDAAGIADPALRLGYLRSRALLAHHGRSYFLAARLLPPARRPAVYALYGFARWTDDVVDHLDGPSTLAERAAALTAIEDQLQAALAAADQADPALEVSAQRASAVPDPIIAALVDTVRRYRIDQAVFPPFLAAMRMDLSVTDYATFADLRRYMRGSAEVIGLQMLPVLGTVVPRAEAEPAAAALGAAFQLTNFLRDIGEDLDRGRVYLPSTELAAFGVDRDLLLWCRRTGRSDRRVRRALAHLVAWTRGVYRTAEPGVALLRPESRPCMRAATRLYAGILDRIVAEDYDVLSRRVAVPLHRRLALAAPAIAQSAVLRRRGGFAAAGDTLGPPEPDRAAHAARLG